MGGGSTECSIIQAIPVLAGALMMIVTDRNFNTTFFDAAGGGPVVNEHLDYPLPISRR